MTPLTIKEIQPIFHLLDPHRIFLRAVLQDELFEKQKCTFVCDLLTDLNECLPCIFRGEFGTVGTLGMLYEVFDFKDLLEDGSSENLRVTRFRTDAKTASEGRTTHLFLDRERDAQALRVWFRPDEMCLGEAHLVESLEPFQTQRQKLLRFWSCKRPCRRR